MTRTHPPFIKPLAFAGARTRLVCVAVAIGSCLYASTGTAFARREKPVISVFTVAPKSVPSEGTVSVSVEAYDEAGAEECTLSSKPAVAGLPVTVRCAFAGEDGYEPFEFPMVMPANSGEKDVKYKLELTVGGPGGEAKAKATVTVEPGPVRKTATDVAAFEDHTCAVLSTGHVDCWGGNVTGELGDSSTATSNTPVETTGITNAVQLGAGGYQSCVLLSTEHIDCWGYNEWGQLGDDSAGPESCERASCSRVPVEVTGISDATQVGVGGLYHTCAVLSTEHIDCWGISNYGALGDGSYTGPENCGGEVIACSRRPVEAVGITDAGRVTAGAYFTCALLETGHVKCWGEGQEGELGNATTTNSDIPVEVKGITNATQVAAGADHACALLSTGLVDCWGSNVFAQLGDGATTNSDTPVETQGISHATELTASENDTCAMLSNGHAACWGENGRGQLGDGISTGPETCPWGEENLSCSKKPVEVADINDVTQVTAGGYHACALRSTEHVDCWGDNYFGELGDSGTEDSDTPVEVAGL